ncbi:MAG TPA: hypothetical protein VFB67_04140 [Candidatus Polarisedimenticolaceae bacterium]|nr:hypothetical protein [Candidatus Polarisedimenticolaceae bacterium]
MRTAGALIALVAASGTVAAADFTKDFDTKSCTFRSSGKNPYFDLTPGFRALFRGSENGKPVENTITVTDETKTVDGVETRIVEERETHGGKLVEVSRNYFAICEGTNSVFYFGEDVDLYRRDEIVGHGGSWLAGTNGAKPGLIMPGVNLLGARYFQEVAPGIAMDQAETAALNETVKTPAGVFEHCLKVRETNPLEPGELEFKLYAPGVGLVQDEGLKLVEYGTKR